MQEAGGRLGLRYLSRSFPPVYLIRRSFMSLLYLIVISLHFSSTGQARRGQGELAQAAGGLFEVAADGEPERTVYNIVVIQ